LGTVGDSLACVRHLPEKGKPKKKVKRERGSGEKKGGAKDNMKFEQEGGKTGIKRKRFKKKKEGRDTAGVEKNNFNRLTKKKKKKKERKKKKKKKKKEGRNVF